jgi:hypothetical protein
VLPFTLFAHVLFVHVFAIGLARGIIQSGGVEVKRPVTVVTLAILPVGLILFGLTDLNISAADTSVPDNKITTGHTKASNSFGMAMTMIAWTTPCGEGGSNGL